MTINTSGTSSFTLRPGAPRSAPSNISCTKFGFGIEENPEESMFEEIGFRIERSQWLPGGGVLSYPRYVLADSTMEQRVLVPGYSYETLQD